MWFLCLWFVRYQFFYVTSHTFSFSFQTLKTRQNFKMSVSLCGTQMYRLKRVTYIHVLFMYFFPKPLPSYYHFIFCDTHIGSFLVFASALIGTVFFHVAKGYQCCIAVFERSPIIRVVSNFLIEANKKLY